MKRISPVLFLTLASAMAVSGQTSIAQSGDRSLAPGPIAELLPDSNAPEGTGFDYPGVNLEHNGLPEKQPQVDSFQLPESNPLPPAGSATAPRTAPRVAPRTAPTTTGRSSFSPDPRSAHPLPLFDTPAQTPPSDTLIGQPAPVMPATDWTAPRTPRSFQHGSRLTGGMTGSTQQPVWNAMPVEEESIISAEPCGCDSEMVIESDCDTCSPGDVIYLEGVQDDCDVCDSDDIVDSCDDVDEEAFYDTGAQRIDESSRRKSHQSNRRRGHKGIFGRHRSRHQTRKKERKGQEDEPFEEELCDDTCEAVDDYADEGYGPEDQYLDQRPRDQNIVAPQVADGADRGGVNTLIGVSGLYFSRNYEADSQYSASRFIGERGLFSNDADHGNFGGFDVNLARRKGNGNGFEVRYFQLDPSRASRALDGGPLALGTATPGGPAIFLSGVGVPGTTAAEIYNFADVHQITRETSIDNAELNLLRLGRIGQRQHGVGRTVSHEYLVGFRYLKFDESFNYSAQAFRPGNVASVLSRADYLNEVSNSLYGAQIGGRTEIGFLRRFSLIIGTKAGIFSNHYENNQNITFHPRGNPPVTAQVVDGPYQGQAFDTHGENSDLTMLGELDLGVTCQLYRNSRLRVGYRALFVSDVALAVPQTEVFFSDLNAVSSPTANDDLMLHGGYFGLEVAY